MTDTAKLRRHVELFDTMANTLEIDLEEQVRQGQLTFDRIERAVHRCTTCSNPDGCETWLAQQLMPAQHPPQMCQNANLFAGLRRDD
ncbi:DUF6455 family protein [Roseovarius sp. EL26]|uniref:DUF6455 family protein n=1 Tax=Roseovarius sp. EL26 TaxID=2126672 RepID=UPI0013C4E9B5|nr:DUF6455 family protein [Roseovarius sp. EL26]